MLLLPKRIPEDSYVEDKSGPFSSKEKRKKEKKKKLQIKWKEDCREMSPQLGWAPET